MSHQRTIIRNAVKALLIAASTDAGSRVSHSRMAPIRAAEIPAISVYTLDESVTPESQHSAPRELTRHLQLVIEAWARLPDSGNVDDELDVLSAQIEKAMHADPTFGGACGDSVLSSTEIGLKLDGDRHMGAIHLVWDVTYRTYAPEAADVTLVDFDTADVKYNIGGAQDPRNEAEDKLLNLET